MATSPSGRPVHSAKVAELVVHLDRAESYREIWHLVDALYPLAPMPSKAIREISDAVRVGQERLRDRDLLYVERTRAALMGISKVVVKPPPKVSLEPPRQSGPVLEDDLQ